MITFILAGLFGRVLRTVHDAILWKGRIEGALFVGLLLLAIYFLSRKES